MWSWCNCKAWICLGRAGDGLSSHAVRFEEMDLPEVGKSACGCFNIYTPSEASEIGKKQNCKPGWMTNDKTTGTGWHKKLGNSKLVFFCSRIWFRTVGLINFCNSWDCLWTEAPAEEEPDDGLTTEEREALLYTISSWTSEQERFSSARFVGFLIDHGSMHFATQNPEFLKFVNSKGTGVDEILWWIQELSCGHLKTNNQQKAWGGWKKSMSMLTVQ